MKMQRFILVDDDSFNNLLSKVAIRKAVGDVDTDVFQNPEEGLEFLRNRFSAKPGPAILFLDLNMPSLSGWEFLEEYDKMSDAIKQHLTIYILTSSVDQRDKDKAEENKHVKGFISKPLEVEVIRKVINS